MVSFTLSLWPKVKKLWAEKWLSECGMFLCNSQAETIKFFTHSEKGKPM